MGPCGRLAFFPYDVALGGSLDGLLKKADGVINLVGILSESGATQSFERLQHQWPGRLAAMVAAQKHPMRLVHVSALGIGPKHPSRYARSKWKGEEVVLERVPEAVVIRPGVIFGPGDQFIRRFDRMACCSPVVPIAGGSSKFQPVHREDVVDVIMDALDGRHPEWSGQRLLLGGSDIYALREIVEMILAARRRVRFVVDLPSWLARWAARLVQWMRRPPITVDQLHLLAFDTVVLSEEGAIVPVLSGLPERRFAPVVSSMLR
jgi:NADH dehydrogenase